MISALVLLAAAAPALIVLGSDFTSEMQTGESGRTIMSTRIIPLIPGVSCFNWSIAVAPATRVVLIEETLELPSPAANWPDQDGVDTSPTRLSADRRVATTPRFVALASGKFGSGWCISDGDPAGPHKITVRHDGKVLKVFDFEVIAP